MKERREFFAKEESCRGVKLGRADVVEVDFCHGRTSLWLLEITSIPYEYFLTRELNLALIFMEQI